VRPDASSGEYAPAAPRLPQGIIGSLARASTIVAGAQVERMDLDEARMRAELAAFLVRASTDGGVVLGRGGVVVLADAPGALHVLVCGPFDARVARVMEREGVDRDEAERRVRANDRARLEYVRTAFDVNGDDRRLYHLIVDTVALGFDASVDVVLRASRARTQRPPPARS
jgi:cytidylate kinase